MYKAEIQHRDARLLLPRIFSAAKKRKKLTYKEAAQFLGRPEKDHSRAVAQICDLLDAAACLAQIPLIALVIVRAESKDINPKAWGKDERLRDAIIERSRHYRFGRIDYEKLSDALSVLYPRGNRAARYFVDEKYGYKLPSILTGVSDSTSPNAIDDLGTDTPDRARSEVWTYARNETVREAVRRRSKGKCELCGKSGFEKANGERYVETHHIIALASQGKDRVTNVIALCPDDHREAHFGKRSKEIEEEMLKKLGGVAYSRRSSKA